MDPEAASAELRGRAQRCFCSLALSANLQRQQEMIMPAIILWLLGVPLTVIILLYLIF
jgi:hypothetical protein